MECQRADVLLLERHGCCRWTAGVCVIAVWNRNCDWEDICCTLSGERMTVGVNRAEVGSYGIMATGDVRV